MNWFEISVRSAYAFAVINYFASLTLEFKGKTLANPVGPITDEVALPLVIEKAKEVLCEIDQLNGKPRIERIMRGYASIYAIFMQDEETFVQNE